MWRRAFTLLDLLVTIGVIALLAAILLPAMSTARNQAKAVLCQNNQRALWQGIAVFVVDNDGHLVGNQYDPPNPTPSHRDWLRGDNANGWQGAPQAGTLWKYIHVPTVYLCPARDHATGSGTLNSLDLTSNGHFDYAIFLSFAGASLHNMPANATVTDPSAKVAVTIPTPYLVEEQPNSINKANIEGGHATSDHLAHNHFGGSYYVSPDGSCHFYIEPSTVSAVNYTATTPHAKSASLGTNCTWGWWDGQ